MSVKTGKRLKMVLVGCGNIGRMQAKTISELEDFQLAAVCDVLLENLEKVK